MNYEQIEDRELDALVAENIFGYGISNQKFTADIASAFEVVEVMRGHGLKVEIASLPEDNGWKVEFYSFPRVGACIDKALPRAICIAALRALE